MSHVLFVGSSPALLNIINIFYLVLVIICFSIIIDTNKIHHVKVNNKNLMRGGF